MKLYNVEKLNNIEIKQYLWLVSWNVVQSKNIWKDLLSWLKSIIWWEINSYSKMLTESREIATKRMIEDAEKLWANAIINIRYSTSAISQWMSEIMAYWTAVII